MATNPFHVFLKGLGFHERDIEDGSSNNVFTYATQIAPSKLQNFQSDSIDVKYIYFSDKNKIYDTHLEEWNKNEINSFVAVTGSTSYFINVKEKPDKESNNYLNLIASQNRFDWGTETIDYIKQNKESIEITKGKIDSGNYFFEFALSRIKSTNPVNNDLLLNLIALKKKLINNRNEEIIHVLILRCLFLKYLEDRGIIDENKKLGVILDTENPSRLISAFNEIKKINGDLFKKHELTSDDIKISYIKELRNFFSRFDYRTGQGSFFPYKFDKIPIQLISNIYESFLRTEDRHGKGIYYTPPVLVDFMISQTLGEKLKRKSGQNAKVLDPACGSGAYLVKAFEMIISAQNAERNFNLKKKILQEQIFGRDLDPNALLIAAFSLYLALLENENPEKIKEKIKKSHPILPDLIGITLIHENALLDDNALQFPTETLFDQRQYDCILANPPWGSIPKNEDEDNKKLRKAIGNKQTRGTMPEYKNVSDYQRSQAFLLRVKKWSGPKTSLCLVVNNSIFLNDNARLFRTELLKTYSIDCFYELSNINEILFKKRVLDTDAQGNKITIGADEPCCVLVMSNKSPESNKILRYISPKLTKLSKAFQIIHFTQKDIKEVQQSDFIEEDMLWRIFVKGGWEEYQLIKKSILAKDKRIQIEKCLNGAQLTKIEKQPPFFRTFMPASALIQYHILKGKLDEKFNWNREFERRGDDESLFNGPRILIKYTPVIGDKFRVTAAYTQSNLVFTNGIVCLKFKDNVDYNVYLAILNSSFGGFYLSHLSNTWGKGSGRLSLDPKYVKNFPFPDLSGKESLTKKISSLVSDISLNNSPIDIYKQHQLDDLILDLYGLLDFEKEIIREFYQINVEKKNANVLHNDLQKYLDKFREVFSFILDESLALNATYQISANLGASICFSIVNRDQLIKDIIPEAFNLLEEIKKNQLLRTYRSNMLNEEKTRMYEHEPDRFYIIKSNLYKDWTIRQAMKDANDEVSLVIEKLPENTTTE